ncbi:flagellar biosynthesis anti-sigma factor FlgM [Aeromonas molluscorum]|uniref:flagellar biosynthesis anti-sigma factor FlgM n=1 Tax=Aeromonas molluscorum TaxID=271417 RepID=UPI003F1C3F47
MKITRTDPIQAQPLTQRRQDTAPTPNPPRQSGESQISATAQTMAQARITLADTPDVDMAKVKQIRQAIGEGRMNLDMDALSQAILELHRR